MSEVTIEYCGQYYPVQDAKPFTIGREGDLAIDDNPYLHRHFLTITKQSGLWWLNNVGSRLTATIADRTGGLQAWLSPESSLPLVLNRVGVVFTAGPTTYELSIHVAQPAFRQAYMDYDASGETTIGPVLLTSAQRALVVVLAEPMLRREGTGLSSIPTSAAAAARLGWGITKFNRKLDNVCDKLDKAGVAGLRGGPGKLATNRRARLVEHAVSSHLVTRADLAILDFEVPDED
ncbi:hypothetical protein M2368_001513 [Arthrobacter sp. JUb119]|uniref:hypothetical protein n=1 Tax=Micrococcaceae TaxID=1268 RepID=UPI000F98217F|nr:hypothetical protein [Arthrobacter sp. JUb115]MCS3492510.1 hypothetical protein [Arthrobacter sp. JUb119]TDU30345.1 hypothetical protein EDF61_101304 [Arthrobacter sp. JUb115]